MAPLSLISSLGALDKVLLADLSGSQDRNKHYLNILRLTALEDRRENDPLGKVTLRMPLDASRGCVSCHDASWKCSLDALGPWLGAQEKEIARRRLREAGPQANVLVASCLKEGRT